jgi:hypothetical protein
MFYRGGAVGARGAHNSEDVGSKPTSGILFFLCFTETQMRDTPLLFYRHGAEAARVAHNHEVTRSKRVVGILSKII